MMNRKPLKYVESDHVGGKFYVAGTRSLLIPISIIESIYAALRDTVGESAEMLIYRIGENIGGEYVKAMGKMLKEAKVDLDESTLLEQVYIAISANSGWGRIDIKKMNLADDHVELELADTPSQELLSGSNSYLERGILAGVYQQITGKRVYYNVDSEAKDAIVLHSVKEIPSELMSEGKLALLSGTKFEEAINQKIADLEARKVSNGSILRSIPDVLIIMDRDKKLVGVNSYAEQLLGYRSSELKGLPLSESPIFSAKMREQIEAACEEAFEGKAIRDLELDIVNIRGDVFSMSFTISGFKYPEEEVFNAILIGRDIQQVKNHVANLQKLHHELESKVKDLQEFHDLAIGRELKMVELKEEIANLKEEIKKLKGRNF